MTEFHTHTTDDVAELTKNSHELPGSSFIDAYISSLATIVNERSLNLDPIHQRAVLALAVMTHSPAGLDELEKLWGINDRAITRLITTAFGNPQLTALAYELFDLSSPNKTPETAFSLFDQNFKTATRSIDRILTGTESELYDLLMQGLSDDEISRRLSKKKSTIEATRTDIRNKVRIQRFSPNGITQVSEFGIPKLRVAASQGLMYSRKFLGNHYANKEIVEDYLGRVREVQPELLAQGWIPLREIVEPTEYQLFIGKKKYQRFLRREKGVIYVREEELPSLRALRKPKELSSEHINSTDIPLSAFYSSEAIRIRLSRAARNKVFRAILTENGYMVDPQEVRRYLDTTH